MRRHENSRRSKLEIFPQGRTFPEFRELVRNINHNQQVMGVSIKWKRGSLYQPTGKLFQN